MSVRQFAGCGGGQLRFFRPSNGEKTKKAKNKPVNSKHVKHTCYEKDGKMYVPYIVRLFIYGIHTEERTRPRRS
jgi:hypothetical protein